MNKRGFRKRGTAKPVYKDITMDSIDEVQMFIWLETAEQAGLIGKWEYHPESIQVIPAYTENVVEEKQLKTKVKRIEKVKTVLNSATYTTDFRILEIKDPRLFSIFRISSDGWYWVDVKGKWSGSFGKDAKYFSLLTKVLWYLKEIFVNKIIVQDLCKATFCPDALIRTKTGKKSKVFEGCKTLKEFLK